MKHTQGKLEVKTTTEASEIVCQLGIRNIDGTRNFDAVAKIYPTVDGGQQEANAKRIEALWNAFNGISTHDALNIIQIGIFMKDALEGVPVTKAVKYLEHGAEMEKAVKSCITLCRTKFNNDSCEDNGGEYDCKINKKCGNHKLLNKLEGK